MLLSAKALACGPLGIIEALAEGVDVGIRVKLGHGGPWLGEALSGGAVHLLLTYPAFQGCRGL